MNAKILSITNKKGGVGKTTTAVSLCAALARKDKKVLLIDLDPHICASIHLRVYPSKQTLTICDIFLSSSEKWEGLWEKVIICQEDLTFDLAPASTMLSDVDERLMNTPEKALILKRSLQYIIDKYDYIIIDCPPHMSVLLVNAIIAADYLIIPIQTDFLALHGLSLLFDTIRMLNKALPSPIKYRVFPTMYDKRTKASRKVMEMLTSKMEKAMFTTVVGIDTRFRDASAMGKTIFDINPKSKGALAYEDLANEVLELC